MSKKGKENESSLCSVKQQGIQMVSSSSDVILTNHYLQVLVMLKPLFLHIGESGGPKMVVNLLVMMHFYAFILFKPFMDFFFDMLMCFHLLVRIVLPISCKFWVARNIVTNFSILERF